MLRRRRKSGNSLRRKSKRRSQRCRKAPGRDRTEIRETGQVAEATRPERGDLIHGEGVKGVSEWKGKPALPRLYRTGADNLTDPFRNSQFWGAPRRRGTNLDASHGPMAKPLWEGRTLPKFLSVRFLKKKKKRVNNQRAGKRDRSDISYRSH